MSELNIPPRFITSFMMFIGLVFVSYLHSTEIKLVEASCNLDAIASCGRFTFVPRFECDTTFNPDSKCRDEYCVGDPSPSPNPSFGTDGGDDEVQTDNDCCLATVAIPPQWEAQLNFIIDRNPGVSGDYCCCNPEMNSEPSGVDDQIDPTSRSQVGSAFTQLSASQQYTRTPLSNPETEITSEDRRECRPPIPYFNGECTDDLCERDCGSYDPIGDNPIHVCKSVFKGCCNYDAARDLVTPYDAYYPRP